LNPNELPHSPKFAADESSLSSLCGFDAGYKGNPASFAVAWALITSPPASFPSFPVTVTFTPLLSFSCPTAQTPAKVITPHNAALIKTVRLPKLRSATQLAIVSFRIPPSSTV
jgi:hypothetical protein